MKKSILCLLVGVMILTTSCKKDDEVNNNNDSSKRKSIAVFNHQNKEMKYSFDIDALNELYYSNYRSDRYILESVTIIDNKPLDKDICPELKFVIVDTEKELTHTTWLMDYFLEKKVCSNKTEYYLDRDVENNNYQCLHYNSDGTFTIISVDDNNYTFETTDTPLYQLRPKWWITCTKKGDHCKPSDCMKVEVANHYWGCAEGSAGCTCVENTLWGEFVNLIHGINININIDIF